MESWLPVPEWNGIYEVSDHGQVRRIAPRPDWKGSNTKTDTRYGRRQFGSNPMRVLKPLLKSKYLQVCLTYGKRTEWRTVHGLVARTFLPLRPSAAHQVNHIDGDKTNNAATNLEWATSRQQQLHSYAHGLSGHKQFRKLTPGQAREVFDTLGQISNREWAARLNVTVQCISSIRTGWSYRDVTGIDARSDRYDWFPCDRDCECRCHQRRGRV